VFIQVQFGKPSQASKNKTMKNKIKNTVGGMPNFIKYGLIIVILIIIISTIIDYLK